MKRKPKHVFWFCSNRMYNSDSVYRVTLFSKLFLMGGVIKRAEVVVHGVKCKKEAECIALKEFRQAGFVRQIMGQEY